MNRHEPITQAAPDFFTGVSVIVDQVDDDVRNELPRKLTRLASAHRAKNATAMKLAAEDMAKFLTGMNGVADAIARASVTHLNRRSRP